MLAVRVCTYMKWFCPASLSLYLFSFPLTIFLFSLSTVSDYTSRMNSAKFADCVLFPKVLFYRRRSDRKLCKPCLLRALFSQKNFRYLRFFCRVLNTGIFSRDSPFIRCRRTRADTRVIKTSANFKDRKKELPSFLE